MPYLMGLVGLALPILLVLAVFMALERLNLINQRLERIERILSGESPRGWDAPGPRPPGGGPEFPPVARPPEDPFGGSDRG